jgi:hypothetical protein
VASGIGERKRVVGNISVSVVILRIKRGLNHRIRAGKAEGVIS